MALVVNDRVQQTGTANTTVSFTLSGSVTGYQSFSVIGNGNTTFYGATDTTGNWEVGIGTYATGGTLTRTTILASSNSGSAVTFSGTVNVFVTYPAEKSINYDTNGVATIGSVLGYSDTGIVGSFASTTAGYNQVVIQNKSTATNASANLNVSNDASTSSAGYAELGINSSTFSNGSGCFNIPSASYLASASTDLSIGTYGAYNIHFATNSNTTDSMTIFNDGGISLGGYGDPGLGSVCGNKFVPGYTNITAAAGTTVLTSASTYYQKLTGSTTQTIQLPDATSLLVGTTFVFDNDSSGVLTITDGATTVLDTIQPGSVDYFFLEANGTVAGSWGKYSWLPTSYDFSSTTANFGTATLTNGTWNGGTIAPGYGGTGLTTFAAANNALYSTSSSALAAGTLPIAAGGTAGTTAATAFNNLSPITTTGDLIIGTGTNTAGRLGIGTSGYVLQSNGTTASWASPPGSSTLNIQDFTATSGQTSFTLTYTVGLVEGVYRNGIKLGQADYTATSGTAIVLGTGAITGDLIEVVYFTAVAVTNVVNTFSAGTTGFTPSTATAGAVTLAGTLNVANGGTGVTTSTGSGNNVLSTSPTLVTPALGTPSAAVLTNATGLPIGGISATGTPSSTTYLRGDSTWSTIVAGASISNDTSTATAEYPLFAAATSGTPTTIYTSNANYTYVPSTGTLSANVLNASSGFHINPTTIAANYTSPANYNLMSAGPITINTGVTVTIDTTGTWVIV